jgi:hypothetical protein
MPQRKGRGIFFSPFNMTRVFPLCIRTDFVLGKITITVGRPLFPRLFNRDGRTARGLVRQIGGTRGLSGRGVAIMKRLSGG